MTRRHSPPLAGALAKSASGALETVAVSRIQNLARGLEELKAQGIRCLGLDASADGLLEDEPLGAPVAFVLGSEDRGLRQHTREVCDKLCRVAGAGETVSLNVSIAAAIALHLAAMARRRAAGKTGGTE
jgi:23S rRNA (guanosine2251-2'-O)-methyltransferase